MLSVNLFRPAGNFFAANAAKAKPVRFKGQLIDEVDQESRKKMNLIDEFSQTEQLTDHQKHAYKEYVRDYKELNEDLQYGVGKKEVTGLMHMSIAQMWQKVPQKYKQMFEHFQQSRMARPRATRQYSSPRLSRSQSNMPETIVEESEG